MKASPQTIDDCVLVLQSFIFSLSKEEADKLIEYLPKLNALLEESNRPSHQEQFPQKQ